VNLPAPNVTQGCEIRSGRDAVELVELERPLLIRRVKTIAERVFVDSRSLPGICEKSACSYIVLHDGTGRLAKEDIALFPGPISEITEIEPKEADRRYRAAIDHPGKQFWREARHLHDSPSSARRSFARFSGRSTNTARSVSHCSTAFRSLSATAPVSGAVCRKATSITCGC
jgi:hypothetical protein